MIAVCDVGDVPLGEGRAVTVGGERIAVFHTPTGWYAIDHACPHAAGPLSDGITADCSVICPLHERRFALDTGEPVGHDGPGVRAHSVEVRGGRVHVALSRPAQLPRPARWWCTSVAATSLISARPISDQAT